MSDTKQDRPSGDGKRPSQPDHIMHLLGRLNEKSRPATKPQDQKEQGPSASKSVNEDQASRQNEAMRSNRLSGKPSRFIEATRPLERQPAGSPTLGRSSKILPPPIPSGPNESLRRASIAGWAIIGLFFGVFGTWAISAPLNGAVVANGFVKVESNRKSLQHLDGGIVKELHVQEGVHVNAGDVLIVLDDSQARAEYQVLSQQYLVLRLTEDRLRTEYNRGTELTLPTDLKDLADDPDVASVWRGQIHQFESRQAAAEGQRVVIKEKIAQLESQIKGTEAQVKSYRAQYDSVQKEIVSIAPLVEKGLIARPRYLQLERSGVALEGQAAETFANVAKARQAIAEQKQQLAQVDNDRMTDISKDLRDTQAKLLEVIPRRANAQAVLGRVEIRAPYTGRVVGLNVFSIGAVINRGDKILDIVPEEETLIIEAQVGVEDISEVHPKMRADIHLTAYKQRITPVVQGEVIQVSADRLTDNRTGNPYYTALIRVDQKELAAIPNVKLYPGMPATVMVPTVERTAFDYIVGPLAMSFNRAFRQR
jgi:HlyD family type I secretion membrane fusion protein